MKIVMMNKYYYLRGGSERYFFDLTHLLERHGHTVIPFSMHNDRNEPSEWSRFFVPNVEYTGPMSPKQKLSAAARTVYYPQARKNFEALINEVKPDIVHAHNIYHQLSYSPLVAAKAHGIPVVLTAHDYKLVCPNNQLFCHGEICERCAGRNFINAFRRRCGKGTLGSLVLSVESYVNRGLMDAMKNIDLVLTPSRFLHDKLVQYGLPAQKVVHRYNMIDPLQYEPHCENERYFLYLGRLAPEKGVRTLLRAIASVPEAQLKIAGEGPEESSLKAEAQAKGLSNVAFLGYRSGEELKRIVQNALAVIVPSEWHENLPYSVLESMAYGKAVIGAQVGGIPELIEHEKTGLLFPAGDSDSLADRIRQIQQSPDKTIEMGRNARTRVEQDFSPEEHYALMRQQYEKLMK